MDKGRLINYGTPHELLNNKSTILYDLVNSLENSECKKLTELAHEAHTKNNDNKSLVGGDHAITGFKEFTEIPFSENEEYILFNSEEKDAFLTKRC